MQALKTFAEWGNKCYFAPLMQFKMPLLNVSKISKQRVGSFQLKEISLVLEQSQRLALVGETGSGKSTMLKIIAGLEEPNTGKVELNGTVVKGPSETLVAGHPQIAYLPQYFELQKFLRVEQVLEYSNHLSATQARNLFRYCRINHLLARKTDELSGGERQRIALCWLLISKPQVLLLDEPFSNLDRIMKQTLKEVLADVEQKLSLTIILVSHDPLDTLPWAHWMMVLKNGKLVQQGVPSKLYERPKNEYVAAMLGDYSVHGKSKAITRPEDWRIEKNKNGNATVTAIQLMGCYHVVQVKKGSDSIHVYAKGTKFKIGDKVKLTLTQP
ncbi:MAG: ATP-binding cassette domain-containing protein [Flammeovirgaceae bacterium]